MNNNIKQNGNDFIVDANSQNQIDQPITQSNNAYQHTQTIIDVPPNPYKISRPGNDLINDIYIRQQPLNKTFNYVDNRLQRILELEDFIRKLNDTINNQENLIENLKTEIRELKNLTTKSETKTYNDVWLRNVILEYNKSYFYMTNGLIDVCTEDKIDRQYATLDPKTSAIIIFHALAKKLNGNKKGTQAIYLDTEDNEITWITTNTDYNYVNPLFISAKNAIDILNQINPIIINNYFN